MAANTPPSSQTPVVASAAPNRLHGLDALRGVAAVLVVLLHAGTPYILHPVPGLLWPVRDASPSVLVDAIYWAIEGCIMPLFFALAGFVAAGLHQSLGSRAFVAHRARRLLVPMLFGCIAVVPLDLYVWLLGCLLDGRCTIDQILRMKFQGDLQQNLWGFSHLWFLQYLFLYSAGLALAASLRRQYAAAPPVMPLRSAAARSPTERMLASWSKPLLVAAPAGIVLWFAPEVVLGFQHSFFPVPAKFVHGALFFAAGVWMHAGRRQLDWLTGHSGAYVVLAVATFTAFLPLAHRHLQQPLVGTERVLLAAALALFAALAVFALSGRFLVWFAKPHACLRYLAEASFWIYLVHHPVVGLAQIDLARTALPAAAKFALTAATALAFSLLTFEAFVRYTWVGAVLHGRRQAKPRDVPAVPQPAEGRAARAA